jgi:O-antigen/teichoic acid export membrane protein
MSRDRFGFPRAQLRARTVRGALVTGAFLALIDGLVVAQGLIVTRLLGPRAIGLYGIVTVTVMTVLALKRVGIDEAYVQQQEAEQEHEFQRAFTLELALSAGFALLICALAPVLAAVYGHGRLLALTLATAYLPVAFALQAPLWVFFRRMDFARQRGLQAIVPAVTFAAMSCSGVSASIGNSALCTGRVRVMVSPAIAASA